MKKDIIEILDFEEGKNKVGRPRLADAKTKRKSLIIACISFFSVILLLIFGYGTLFGINMNKLLGNVNNNNSKKENILITDINPIVKDITLKENTIRKVYLTVLPADSTNKTIRYKSADKNIATVDENGRVRAIKEGNTIIYAYTTDGSLKKASFNIKVIKDVKAECNFTSISKASDRLNYNIECKNAKVKQIEYKTLNDDYRKIDSKKLSDSILFSKEQLENDITLKVVYYPNNSKITKAQPKTNTAKTTKQTSINSKTSASKNTTKPQIAKKHITPLTGINYLQTSKEINKILTHPNSRVNYTEKMIYKQNQIKKIPPKLYLAHGKAGIDYWTKTTAGKNAENKFFYEKNYSYDGKPSALIISKREGNNCRGEIQAEIYVNVNDKGKVTSFSYNTPGVNINDIAFDYKVSTNGKMEKPTDYGYYNTIATLPKTTVAKLTNNLQHIIDKKL